MKISYNGYFNLPHSWASVAHNMTREFINLGHHCRVINRGPNGSDNIPSDLKKVINSNFSVPDLAWSYTIPPNWTKRFPKDAKFKAGMYAYESSILPKKKNSPWPADWGDLHSFVDKVVVPSNYVKEIFINAGTPGNKIAIVPHGVNMDVFCKDGPKHKINTNKSFKFLAVATNLWRKNIRMLLQAFTAAFTKDDDVCLVIKTSKKDLKLLKQHEYDIEQDLQKCLSLPNCPEIITIYGSFPSIAPLYRSCDCYVNVSASEGFGIPLLESLACGIITIAPRYSGLLDFMNDSNSFLIDCKEIFADPRYQYWDYNPEAKVCSPNLEDLIDKMKYIIENKNSLVDKMLGPMQETAKKFSWKHAANTMIRVCK